MATVYVGNKPLAQYILAVLTLYNKGEKEILLRGRGRQISKTVDVVELLKNKHLMNKIEVEDIKIGTENAPNGKQISYIEIKIKIK
jgi:DNA-binding protein